MAQLFFRYGAMNSGKSIDILKVAHNYEEQGKPVILMTSGVDDRTGVGQIASRMGLERAAVPIFAKTNIFDYVAAHRDHIACVLIDEAQFLQKHHVLECARVVDELNVPVMTFGLKNDFKNDLFEGSKYLLLYADKIEEMKTICWFCYRKATMNLRVHDHKPVYTGEQIQIDGNESYYPVCREHYFNPPLDELQQDPRTEDISEGEEKWQ
ncbi:thymidine kinase [Lactobacillus selangorensis]|uniref:Thymidine kinase n=1 Tax=Lactobacillus selangorensis TaxID=81857 RepID=A0A0R2FNP4_9LACO|nr:thymidine kinase [Lactobacillus selangorensis]KRN29302.1 thymidine kinase [Lactobacillus selangorensis]KRN34169.1 thymidine kinase [Lactobacillus selangorensis]